MTPPPINIDGTDITGATIDGADVSEVTVDGTQVFGNVIPDRQTVALLATVLKQSRQINSGAFSQQCNTTLWMSLSSIHGFRRNLRLALNLSCESLKMLRGIMVSLLMQWTIMGEMHFSESGLMKAGSGMGTLISVSSPLMADRTQAMMLRYTSMT